MRVSRPLDCLRIKHHCLWYKQVVSDLDDCGVPASVAAAWGRRGRAGYGPRPGLSLERIGDPAVGVAAAEGLAAVSMVRLGKELGTSAMALYRYVAAKDELLDLM